MAGTNSNAINYFSPAKWVVSTVAGEGTHTTIAGALAVASTGDTIFVMPGTYSESNTVSTAVNIVGQTGDGLGNVTVTGTFTVTAAITVNLSNLYLTTPVTTYFLAVTGSAASIVNLTNCYLNCSVATGIHYTSSSSSSAINLYNCSGNLGTTSIGYHTMSSTGNLTYDNCYLTNTGGSTTQSSNSAGVVYVSYCEILAAFSTSSSAQIAVSYSIFSLAGTTVITTAGTGISSLIFSQFVSGSASAISIGTGTTVVVNGIYVSSSNTNAITGAGTCNATGILYAPGGNFLNNTTTQSGGTIQGLRAGTAPSAGYVGEQIRATGSAISMSNNTPTNICSISLSPGIWDISALVQINAVGVVLTEAQLGISINTASFTGTVAGDSSLIIFNALIVLNEVGGSIPSFRVTLSSTTVYFLVAETSFASGSATGQGRISATRVG